MKLLIPLLLLAANAFGTTQTTLWHEDSPTDFDLTILGTGFATGGGEQTEYLSPSGLWDLRAGNWAGYRPEDPTRFLYGGGEIKMIAWEDLTFLGAPRLSFSTYFLGGSWPILPILSPEFQGPSGWSGGNLLAILDTPVLEDSSTWRWVFHSYVHKVHHVPDAGSTGLLLGMAVTMLGGISRFAYRKA